MSYLEIRNISKSENGRRILSGISFGLEEGYRMAIAGETGSGKSTLLKMIGGLVQPDGGEVYFEGRRVEGPLERLIPGQPGIAYLSQHFELRNNYRVEEILEIAGKIAPEKAERIFEVCQVDHLLKRKTDRVSGGERQRIALARALVTDPRLLLLDEPFSNLDTLHKNQVKTVLEEVNTKLGITCILVSHDPVDTLSWADEILVLREGELVQRGRPEELYLKPVDGYVAALFGRFNQVGRELAEAMRRLPGYEAVGEHSILRPEAWVVEKIQRGEEKRPDFTKLAGEVLAARLMGCFRELVVRVPGQELAVVTLEKDIHAGDRVHLVLRG